MVNNTEQWQLLEQIADQTQGRKFQFDHWPQWQWKVQYFGLDLFRSRNHQYVYGARSELAGTEPDVTFGKMVFDRRL
jgi:hypothetical protein